MTEKFDFGLLDHVKPEGSSGSGYVVSTIVRSTMAIDRILGFMGSLVSDYRLTRLAEPGDFETMVFPATEDGMIADFNELDFARYETEDEARNGHAVMVKKWGS